MSERILKALMQLFAIVAKINVIEESDEIVAADSSKFKSTQAEKPKIHTAAKATYLRLKDIFFILLNFKYLFKIMFRNVEQYLQSNFFRTYNIYVLGSDQHF